MKIRVFNPKDDLQGNHRENIFIVMDEEDNYIGSGYVFPRLTPQLTPEHPLNIFLDMHVDDSILNHEIGGRLFASLEKRAEALASVQPRSTYLYYGTTDDTNALYAFLKDKGYEVERPSYLMYRDIPKTYYEIRTPFDLIMSPSVSESLAEMILKVHNQIFIQPLTAERLHELQHKEGFKNISLYDKADLLANMILFIEEVDGVKVGRIENLFVKKEVRRQGVATMLLEAAFNYFNSHFIKGVSLEVWSANSSALEFYQARDFEILTQSEYYIGKMI